MRESRQELRKFLREVKKSNPAATCSMQYDKLYVDKKCYTYNTAEGRVVENTVSGTLRDSSNSSGLFRMLA